MLRVGELVQYLEQFEQTEQVFFVLDGVNPLVLDATFEDLVKDSNPADGPLIAGSPHVVLSHVNRKYTHSLRNY